MRESKRCVGVMPQESAAGFKMDCVRICTVRSSLLEERFVHGVDGKGKETLGKEEEERKG